MATLEIGYLHFIEANSGNQEWKHDPETIDISNFTPWTDRAYLQVPQYCDINWVTGLKVTPAGAKAVTLKSGKRYYEVLSRGVAINRDTARDLMNFFMLDRHTKSSSYKQLYFIAKFDSNDYAEFVDASGTVREYAQIACKGGANMIEFGKDKVIFRIYLDSAFTS